MGAVVGAIVTSIATSAGASAFVGKLIGAIVSAAFSFLTSGLFSNKKAPSASTDPGGISQMIRESVQPRRVIYGLNKVSGPIVYVESTGENNKYVHFVIALSGHELQSIDDIYINNDVLTLSGREDTGTYAGYVWVDKFLGTSDQAANSYLVAESANKWTTDHRLRGIGYLTVKLLYDQSKFPEGIPNISAVVKGKKLYDFRTETTYYSTNPALMIYDYLTNSDYGLGASTDEIDLPSFISLANLAEETVSLSAGGTIERYPISGVFDTDQTPADILEQMASSFAGKIGYSGGKFYVTGGAYATPLLHIAEDDIIGPLEIQTKLSRKDRFNSVKGTYINPENNYQSSDYPQRSDTTYIAEDNYETIWKDLELRYTQHAAVAQRIAKIVLERNRRQEIVTFTMNLKGLKIRPGDNVTLSLDKYGWNQKVFEVLNWSLQSGDVDNPNLQVALSLQAIDSNVYSWSVDDEQEIISAPEISYEQNIIGPFTATIDILPWESETDLVTTSLSSFQGYYYE